MKIFETISRLRTALFNNKEKGKNVFNEKEDGSWTNNLKDIRQMIKDTFNGTYTMSKRTIFIVLGGIIYVISPLDFLPEFIPIIGVLDDVAIIAFVYKRLKRELDRYKSDVNFQDAEVISQP